MAVAGLEDRGREALLARPRLELANHRPRDPAPACRGRDEHALELDGGGVVRAEAAARDRGAVVVVKRDHERLRVVLDRVVRRIQGLHRTVAGLQVAIEVGDQRGEPRVGAGRAPHGEHRRASLLGSGRASWLADRVEISRGRVDGRDDQLRRARQR